MSSKKSNSVLNDGLTSLLPKCQTPCSADSEPSEAPKLLQIEFDPIPDSWYWGINDPENFIWVKEHDKNERLIVCRRESEYIITMESRWRFEVWFDEEAPCKWDVSWVQPADGTGIYGDEKRQTRGYSSRDEVVASLNDWLWCHQRFEGLQKQLKMRTQEMQLAGAQISMKDFPDEHTDFYEVLELCIMSLRFVVAYDRTMKKPWRVSDELGYDKKSPRYFETADEALDLLQSLLAAETP